MKKFSRIIVLLLILVLTVSLMVMPGVFASAEPVTRAKTLYDQNQTKPSVKTTAVEMQFTEKTSTNGVKYYNVAYKDGWSVEDGGYTEEPFIQIAPSRHYLKDGWRDGDTAAGTDDTDYLVFDFDLSTDTNQFDQLYLQTLFYYGKETAQEDGSVKGKRTSAQSGHYILYGDSGDDAYFTISNDEGTKLPIDVESYEEWAHITMIVDATQDTARTMYLYYNGQFIASRICMLDTATYLESIRISLGTTGVAPDLSNESISIANSTIKSFPKGYIGDLSKERKNLGSRLYPLSSFADLNYCLDNLPENTIAKVTHSDLTETPVTKISDLDGNLKAGDTVLLYRDIARKIVVPGTLEGDSMKSTVAFELNGHSMAEPLILPDYEELDWIVRGADGELYGYEASGSMLYGKGAQEYTDGAVAVDNLSAFINGAFPTGISDATLKLTFLKDTSIKYTTSVKYASSRVTYDLNGNRLTISGGKLPFQSGDSTARIVVRDGELINCISNPIYMTHAMVCYFVDVDLILNSSLTDQRAGTLVFINSKINNSNTVTSLKSHSGKSCYAVFDGCEIVINGASPISFSNLRTSSARRGSMNNFVGVYNTTASGNASLIHANYYANEWQSADDIAKSNQNIATISLQGSNVTVSGDTTAILVSIQSLADCNNSYTFADGFNATTNIYIDDTDINADTVISTNDDEAMSIIAKNGVTVGKYTANTNVTIQETSIKTGSYVFSNTIGSGTDNGSLVVELHDGVMLTSKKWSKEDSSAVTVEFAEGVKLAYSYDVTYPYIATLDWTDETLVGDRPETTTVKLNPIFADGMVLQANKDINIYGTCASIGATIEVKIGEETATTTVGGDGKWCATLPAMNYAKGVTIYINEIGLKFPETKLQNVNIGEIFMMSGQSNAVYGAYKMEDFAEYRSNADNFDNIYAFAVNQGQSIVERAETANSGWYKVSSKTLTRDDRYTGISAIAYVTATRLATELGEDVAIGIIDVNFNGSTVEAWMSSENLAKVDPDLNEKYTAYRNFYVANGTYPAESDVAEYGDYIASGKLYQKMACACYNAMIAPFFDGFSIRAVIWYQGAGNASSVTENSDGYSAHFNGVRSTFREVFADGNLPVFIIQSPPRMNNPYYFRALQYNLANNDENTYIVMSLYAGSTYSSNELKYTTPSGDGMAHYERKSVVGHAVADSLLENIYGKGNISAPKILSVQKREGAIVITFDRELTIDMGTEMVGFEIATFDGEWAVAKAAYANKTITLTADGVATPERVRYGYDKSILVLDDGTEIIHNKEDGSFVYDEAAGTVTITANGKTYVIYTADPGVIGGRMTCNVVATNGTALPIFMLDAE